MCGIYGLTGWPEKDKLLDKMAQLQVHRGPDGQGMYVSEPIAMGMRRLSIIDLENGQQPFWNREHKVAVFCNGEIYNYKALRQQLIEQGYPLKTNSDIEVIPHLYDQYGLDFVQKIEGMYAIALYDLGSNICYLIRDRLGIKPIYYYLRKGQFAFASEMKSILALPDIDRTIDDVGISAYLELMYIPTPVTPFKHIRKCESGTVMAFNLSKMNYDVHHYWDLNLEKKVSQNEHSLAKSNFEDSIKKHLQMDVSVGFFLSGGVDSSAVVSVASAFVPKGMKSYHLNWEGINGKRSECDYAQQVSEKYSTEHHVHDLKDIKLSELLPKLLWHMDEPLADPALIPTYILSKVASKEVKVIFSGAGGDELFAGYPHHFPQSFLRAFLLKYFYSKDVQNSYFDRRKSFHSQIWKKLYSDFQNNPCKSRLDTFMNQYKGKDYFNAVMGSDILSYLQDNILMLTDKMTMAASLECRVPFLDYHFVEQICCIPSSYKNSGPYHKHLIHDWLAPDLPVEIFKAKKEGFGIPVDFLLDSSHLEFDDMIINGLLKEKLGMSEKMLKKVVLNRKSRVWSDVYWRLIILEIWLRVFSKP